MTEQTPPNEGMSSSGGETTGEEVHDAWGDGETTHGREWLSQLQAMIDNVATQAAPVMREIGAKAAELAAIAGEKAGPIAHKAAEVTESAGTKLAERGRVVAADLRRDAAERRGETGGMEPGRGAESWPADDQAGRTPDSADSTGE
jgi:hypothetical protein